MTSPSDLMESSVIEEPVVKKEATPAQKANCARARSIKALKKEAKLIQNESYANELKNISNHMERLYSQLNMVTTSVNSLITAKGESGGIKRKLDEVEEEIPKVKKKKVDEEEEGGPINQWLGMLAQIVGASTAVGTLYIFKRIYNSDPDKEHIKRYENFTL